MDRRGFLGGLLALAVAPRAKPALPVVYTRPVWRSKPYAGAYGLRGIVDDGDFASTVHYVSRSV